jgi:hypothetical protein
MLLAAMLQVLAAPLAAIADASLERDAARFGPPVSHAESPDSAKCPPVHPADCAFCRAVASLDTPVQQACELPLIVTAQHRLPAAEAGIHTAARFSRARPRAPPQA